MRPDAVNCSHYCISDYRDAADAELCGLELPGTQPGGRRGDDCAGAGGAGFHLCAVVVDKRRRR